MKVSRVFCFVGAFAAMTCVAADAPGSGKKLTKDEVRAKIFAIRDRLAKKSGGVVVREATGKVFEIINKQTAYSAEEVENVARKITMRSQIPVSVVSARTDRAGAVLELVSSGDGKMIVCAPEDGWARLDVSKLTPGVDAKARLERLTKELWRGVAYAMGIGYSAYQPCLMRAICNVGDLDGCKMVEPGPGTLSVFGDVSPAFGIKPVEIASYRGACEAGWAPPPTNDVQKAIWDEVHKLPTNPLPLVKPTR